MMNLTGPLRTAYTETTIHFAGPTDRASYEKMLTDPNRGRQRHAQRMIEHIDHGRPIRTEYPHYSVQAFALGDQLTLVALSGEVVVDFAIRLQGASLIVDCLSGRWGNTVEEVNYGS